MDLLPICRELGIPLVLDYHHHNIVHSPGTRDITPLFPAIAETWTRKGITQKQHYSEPCAGAVTPRDMRKHSSRVSKLPSCDPSMDLMIEAKDKEQAVLELYQKYGICGGGEGFNEVVPHERRNDGGGEVEDEAEAGMGGSERRVYYPLGKEEWLAPKKKVVKKKDVVEEKVEDEPNDEEVGNEPKKARRKAVGGKKETAEKSGPKQKRARKATLDADAQPPPAPKTKNTKPDPQHSLEDPPPRLTRSRAKKLDRKSVV